MDTQLNEYTKNYTDFNSWLIRRRYQHLSQYFKGSSCLEMGCADGAGTAVLLEHFDHLTVVDGSSVALDNIGKQYPSITRSACDFETMDFSGSFDTIMLAHILEHVDDPVEILLKAKESLAPNGVMIVDVPNGDSLHRQMGVHLGLLDSRVELNEADLSIGHQRVYTPETLLIDIHSARLKIVEFGGMFIKVLPQSDTELLFDDRQIEAMFQVGVDNPSVAAEIYAIVTQLDW